MTQSPANARYATVRDFIDACKAKAVNAANEPYRAAFIGTDMGAGAGFLGADCKHGAAVLALIESGWDKGRDSVREAQAKVSKTDLVPLDRRRRLKRTDFGDTLHMHDVYAGRLNTAWTQARRKVTQGRQQVSICVNSVCSVMEAPEVLFWRGAAAVMLAELLDEFGYTSRIVVAFGGELLSDESKYSCRVTVKDFGMPLDISTASAILLPGFFRALGHAWMAATDPNECVVGMSLPGRPVIEPDEFFIGPDIRDEATARNWAEQAIKQVNSGGIDDLESVI
ncbi:MAG: hypothetical protein KGL39_03915 [Patescibacteria group bacterium]|nr:hypothetical protein [Patescibacteria group bacterium]